jgi:1-acyl-sn-glycerol-3-phosphate acyltransferase
MLVEAYALWLFFMQVHCKVEGLEKLPPKGTTFLVVCNHLSNYDHMLMLVKLRRYPISFISKPENFEIPLVGRYLWHSGFLSIDRGSARNAIRTIGETAKRLEDGHMCYGVFPEGTRSRKGILLPFHSGVFLSAVKAKAPILVIHVENTQKINHRGPFLPTRVKMDVMAYLDSDYTRTHTDREMSEEIRAMMLEKYPNP